MEELRTQDPNPLSSSPTNYNYESPERVVNGNKGKLCPNGIPAYNYHNCNEFEDAMPTVNSDPAETFKTRRTILQFQTKTAGSTVTELISQDPNILSSSPMTGSRWKVSTGNNELTLKLQKPKEYNWLGGARDPSGSGAAPMHE